MAIIIDINATLNPTLVAHSVLLGGASTLFVLMKQSNLAASSILAVCNKKSLLEVTEPLRGGGVAALPTVSAISKAFVNQVCCANLF